MDQLKTEGDTTYSYNAWGDRTNNHTYTPGGLTNGFGHDANDSVLSDNARTYTYDARSQLVTKGTDSYVYDHVGRRTVTNDNKTTHFVNNGLTVAYELNEQKKITKAIIDNIAELTVTTDGTATVQYTHRDVLGSTVLLSNQAGEVSTYEYDAFGNTTPGVSNTLATSYQYTNQQNDGDLYYYNGRYYDPFIGRFTQPDLNLRGDVLTMNRFAYVSNNPFRYTDPTGWSKEGSVDHETFVDHLSKTAGVAVGIVEGFLSDVQAAIELSFSQNAYSKYKNAKNLENFANSLYYDFDGTVEAVKDYYKGEFDAHKSTFTDGSSFAQGRQGGRGIYFVGSLFSGYGTALKGAKGVKTVQVIGKTSQVVRPITVSQSKLNHVLSDHFLGGTGLFTRTKRANAGLTNVKTSYFYNTVSEADLRKIVDNSSQYQRVPSLRDPKNFSTITYDTGKIIGYDDVLKEKTSIVTVVVKNSSNEMWTIHPGNP